jgi:D-alanine-D-alanine ligase
MKILVLLGDNSPEREVSLRSGAAVTAALKEAGFEVEQYDPVNGDEGLNEAVSRNDIVFPILHGINGEDGVIQAKLESMGKPFLGSTAAVSKVTFDKQVTHSLLEKASVLMPKFAIVSSSNIGHELFQKPFVLKPIEGGSSLDTIIARHNSEKYIQKAIELLKKYPEMLLEELIEGLELTVPVLDENPLPVIAIVPPTDFEFNYDNKYNGKTQEICPVPPSMVPENKQKESQEIALKVHRVLGARHLSRTDIIMSNDGKLYVLEINTMPGMTDQSLMPKAAAVAGYSMEKLVKKFVEIAGR